MIGFFIFKQDWRIGAGDTLTVAPADGGFVAGIINFEAFVVYVFFKKMGCLWGDAMVSAWHDRAVLVVGKQTQKERRDWRTS